jgi:hypothetical protein
MEQSPGSGSTQGHETPANESSRVRMLEAAEELHRSHADEVAVSTSRLLNPLLDLWSMACEFGPQVAGPVEELLTVYAGPRDLAAPAELEELVERLRKASELATV